MLTCPVCSTPAVAGARFCFNCGRPLVAVLEGEAERRVVTVIFGDLSDFTSWAEDLDPERVGVVTDRVLAACAKAVTDMGGHVDKLTGDGIMALFGAPTAHEDDAERAIRAAAAMQSAVLRLVTDEDGGGRRLGLRVGVNTGEVLAGVQANLSYTVVGDAVNTAARLSDAAGIGAVVAGKDTALATMAVASWRSLVPLRLKGKREPVPAYELVALRSAASVRVGLGPEAPFIGREPELAQLIGRSVDAAERSQPAVLLVAGEAGIGKTRLVQELTRFVAEMPGARVLWGKCTEYGESRDLAPVAEMVKTVCGVNDADDAEAVEARVRRTVARLDHPSIAGLVGVDLADRLLELVGLTDDGGALPREGTAPGEARRRRSLRVVDAAVELFRALSADAPLMLCVDDLQWASPALLSALITISRRLSGPSVLVGIGREELLERTEWVRSLPSATQVSLGPLDDSASERLLRGYLGGADLDPVLVSDLLTRTQGNPFFLGELLQLLVDRGVLRHEGSAWQLVEMPPDDVLPAGVQAVLAARIDSLELPTRALLRDAALVGPRFSVDALAALGHEEPSAALDELVGRQIITPVPDQPGLFDVVHALARDVAYAGIPKAERARRHAVVAAWAVSSAPGTPAEVDSLTAAQAERAVALAREMSLPGSDPAWGARLVGFTALVRLAQSALGRDDNRAAHELLARAFALHPDDGASDLVVPARLAWAEALAQLWELEEAEAQVTRVLGESEAAWRAGGLVVLGDIRRKQGRDDDAQACFVQALTAASDVGADRIVGEALRQLGLLDYRRGRLADAEKRFTQARVLAQQIGDSRGAGWALQHLAWSATTRGDYEVALIALRDAAGVFTALDDVGGLAWCAGTEAFVRLLEGRLTVARELAHTLLSTTLATTDPWSTAALLTIDAMAGSELGDVTTAIRSGEEAVALFTRTGDTWGMALAQVGVGSALRAAGRLAEARVAFEACLAGATEHEHRMVAALGLVQLGLLELEEQHLDAAAAAAGGAVAVFADVDVERHAVAGAQVLLAQVLRAQGRAEEAVALLRDVAAATEQSTLLFPRRQALAHLAGALLETGRPEEAVLTVEQAAATPAEDVRSKVVSLRVLSAVRAAQGDQEGAHQALLHALEVAGSTEHVAERAATERALAAIRAVGAQQPPTPGVAPH